MRTLFDEGRRLMQAGRFEQACPKLEAARKAYPAAGVFLNLGDCYQHLGRTASAWAEFGEAVSAATSAGRADVEAEARRRQTALEPSLCRLSVRITTEAPGLVIKQDGKPLDRASWGTAIPVDPGTHLLSAEAAGRVTWSSQVAVAKPGTTATVTIPDLAESPVPSAPVERSTRGSDYWTSRRVASVTVAGVGIVGMGVGGALALIAKSRYDAASAETVGRHDDSLSALRTATVATVVFATGVGVSALGIALWLTAPRSSVSVGAGPGSILLCGRFR